MRSRFIAFTVQLLTELQGRFSAFASVRVATPDYRPIALNLCLICVFVFTSQLVGGQEFSIDNVCVRDN